jgi:GTP-binding protein HflX
VETLVQRRRKADPRFVVGRGKLEELILASMQQGADLILFDRDLTPAQARSIADATEAKVIDRTQLILDIFAQRATTRDGKLQVELAQLKYILPRLAGQSSAMSRLAGGIGGRGPGETKLEIDRRRAKDRLHHLQKQIKKLAKQRQGRRQRRLSGGIPTAAIVGYTNAGKSTLLNALTGSTVLAEDKLFATLDPTTRRLRFPDERELVLTDTVGFIRDLPPDLVTAFKATLEELEEADLLLHVVDISNPAFEDQIEAVDRILEELELQALERLIVFNKIDAAPPELDIEAIAARFNAITVSALNRPSLKPLTERLIAGIAPHERGWRWNVL